MFWIILIIVQLIVWYLTFFKTKRMVKETFEEGYRKSWKFVETNERFKFPLWALFVGFLVSLVPIAGLGLILYIIIRVANMSDSEFDRNFDGNRPSFYLVKIFTKEV